MSTENEKKQPDHPEYLNTTQAAKRLHISRSRVLKMLAAGQIKGKKVGRDWVLTGDDVWNARLRRGAGRPVAGEEEE